MFVHGVLSDSNGSWYHAGQNHRQGVYWPDVLAKDPEFRQYSTYLGGYFTNFDAREFGVSDCADELFRALGPSDNGNKSVLECGVITFVCHSTGDEACPAALF